MKLHKPMAHALAVLILVALPALALDLNGAKASGQVGETHTGYLAAVKPSPEVDALVADINTKRKAQYQRIAEKNEQYRKMFCRHGAALK